MKVYTLYNGTYKRRFLLVAGCGEKDFCKWFKRRFGVDTNEDGLAGCHLEVEYKKTHEHLGVVWVGFFVPKKSSISKAFLGVLSHEILHATISMLEHYGVDLSDQEAVCYAFDDLYGQALSKLVPEKKNRRPRK